MMRIGQLQKGAVAAFDVVPGKLQDTLDRETLHHVGGHHAAIHHGGAARAFREPTVASDVAHESTGKSPSWLNCKTPYSPRLTRAVFGPILRIARPALTRLDSPDSIRASSSLSVRMSMRSSSLISSGREVSIQWFMVSAATIFGLAI